MSSRDLPVSVTLVLGSQGWTNPLGFSVGPRDLNSGPFIHWAIFLAINVSSIHINIIQWVLGGGVEKWLSSLECLLLLQRIWDWFSAPNFYQLPVTPAPGVWCPILVSVGLHSCAHIHTQAHMHNKTGNKSFKKYWHWLSWEVGYAAVLGHTPTFWVRAVATLFMGSAPFSGQNSPPSSPCTDLYLSYLYCFILPTFPLGQDWVPFSLIHPSGLTTDLLCAWHYIMIIALKLGWRDAWCSCSFQNPHWTAQSHLLTPVPEILKPSSGHTHTHTLTHLYTHTLKHHSAHTWKWKNLKNL